MNDELQQWFSAGAPGDVEVRPLAVLRRHGHPLLYLPRRRALTGLALDLYPAQRPAARASRQLWRWLCASGLGNLLPRCELSVSIKSALGGFLASLTGQRRMPHFAILAGNPHAPGRRFIFLVFDDEDRPCAVVKAGGNPHAMALIEQEAAVLGSTAATAGSIPRLRAVHRTATLHALALDYVAGRPPTAKEEGGLAEVLRSWIDTTKTVTAAEIPAWPRLLRTNPSHPVLDRIRPQLERVGFHPVLYHGDFAPWNVKVQTDGSWCVLDWERGELAGMPGWDWFHYRVQVGLLVQRWTAATHARAIDCWLTGNPWQTYARQAGVAEVMHALFLAYLIYSMEILGPSQSLPAKRELLNTLAARWKTV